MRPSLSLLGTTARDILTSGQAFSPLLCKEATALVDLHGNVTIVTMCHMTLSSLLLQSHSRLGTMLCGFHAMWLSEKRLGEQGLYITQRWNGDCTWLSKSSLFGATEFCPTAKPSGRLFLKSRLIWQNNFSSLALSLVLFIVWNQVDSAHSSAPYDLLKLVSAWNCNKSFKSSS